MDVYKAHFIHPYTHVPLIVYFNESEGYVTFEKDQEVLQLLLQLDEDLAHDQSFLSNVNQVSNLCKTQYPVSSFKDVFEFLEHIGIGEEDLNFKQLFLH
ncbi:hypothetical protein [Halalkalibacter krulwichiae]|uniref:Uncharacterized protein n=1 Tax=Halalkalibacter krulwichiae TaxID=199441 RepID=A0A1X9M6E4_9BACI|nr:hypothetical protein [Halalkalibacter krulwichiae]ARK29006.1 hypothetical protein BkAM31D_03530 [Halalkalibacter krulwichiae]